MERLELLKKKKNKKYSRESFHYSTQWLYFHIQDNIDIPVI